jgi:ABC-type antimicrobial peptide transport system permease subunit
MSGILNSSPPKQRPKKFALSRQTDHNWLATGTVIGLAASIVLTRLMSSLLFGVSASDPLIFATVPLLLGIVALAACFIPARRATRVSPVQAVWS